LRPGLRLERLGRLGYSRGPPPALAAARIPCRVTARPGCPEQPRRGRHRPYKVLASGTKHCFLSLPVDCRPDPATRERGFAAAISLSLEFDRLPRDPIVALGLGPDGGRQSTF
jgi:hypothetical protein